FLCDSDDVLRLRLDAALVHRIQQALRQIRIGMYLRHMLDGYELELHCTCWRYRHVSLSLRGSARNACKSSGVSMSNAMPGRSITSERIPAAVAFERCRRKLPWPYSIAIRAGGMKSTPLVPVQSRDGMKVIGSEAALNAKSISDGTSLGKSAAIERIREDVADSSSTIWFTAALWPSTDPSKTMLKPKWLAISITSSEALNTTTRCGARARARTLRTS